MKRFIICIGEDPVMYQSDDAARVQDYLQDDFTFAVDTVTGKTVHDNTDVPDLPEYPNEEPQEIDDDSDA